MFAYCGNNPVASVDYNGSRPRDIQDDNSPTAIDVDQLTINGQGREPFASTPFGTSDLGDSGCGAIAVHNALVLQGLYSSIGSWIDYFESRSSFRLFGVMPWEIDDALDHEGVSYMGSSDPAIVENCKKGGVVIVTYWNTTESVSILPTPFSTPISGRIPWLFDGAHTIAITYHDNAYWVYNAWNGATEALPYNSINYCTTGGAFIYGYYIAP